MRHLANLPLDGFNERRLTAADLDRICERDGITIITKDVETSFYIHLLGRAFIVVPRRLRGLRREFVIWHEIGHHLMHGGRDAGTQAFWFGLVESKNEVEADAFAAIALVPRTALDSYEWLEENPTRFALSLWRDRRRLRFLYGV